jgi:hypothetical protein
VNTNEGKNFESIALADQVFKDRRYLIAKHYFSELADGTFQTWRDLLYMGEGIFLDIYEEINLLARQVWNYGYFKTNFAVDDFPLYTTLARVFNDPPYLDWDIRCPTHTQGGNLGFAWHIMHTSKQIYAISRLTTELCPSFLPQGIEKQYFSDLPLLLVQWREYDFIYQELHKKGLIIEVPDMIIPKNHGESLHSFAAAILCKTQDLLRLRFIGVPEIDQFRQKFLDYYCYCRGISPHLRAEGTWTSTEIEIKDLLINPTFAAEADIEFIEPVANYFPPVPDPPTRLPGDLDSGSNIFYESEEGEK